MLWRKYAHRSLANGIYQFISGRTLEDIATDRQSSMASRGSGKHRFRNPEINSTDHHHRPVTTPYFPEDGIQTGLILISILLSCFVYLLYKSKCKRPKDVYQDEMIKRSQFDPMPIWDWSCRLLKYRKRNYLVKKFANLLPPSMDISDSKDNHKHLIFWLNESTSRCNMKHHLGYSDIEINRLYSI